MTINENQTIWLGLAGSVTIHGLLFAFSGPTFIQPAHFSVKPSVQMVEVSLEEIKDSGQATLKPVDMPVSKVYIPSVPRSFVQLRTVSNKTNNIKSITTQSVLAQKNRSTAQSISAVKVRANPDYSQNPAPEYPELSKQMRQEGLVLLTVDVDRSGFPVLVKVKQSSGYRLLDQAATKAVGNWKFQPARIGSIPIESMVTVPIRFRLEK